MPALAQGGGLGVDRGDRGGDLKGARLLPRTLSGGVNHTPRSTGGSEERPVIADPIPFHLGVRLHGQKLHPGHALRSPPSPVNRMAPGGDAVLAGIQGVIQCGLQHVEAKRFEE